VRLGRACVGDVLDANFPGAVHDGCPHRDLQRPDGRLAVESSDVDSLR
jgi:hypothetical protein